jgi:AIPR protein
MKPTADARTPRNSLTLPFFCLRNISAPEDTASDRKVFSGQMPLAAILEIPTDENVRDYLVDAEGKQRRKPTQVHQAIRTTLRNNPDDFSTLNSGVTIVAHSVEVDDKARCVKLVNPSIINGSQTQGVVRDFQQERKRAGLDLPPIHVKFEIVVTQDDALIAETAISRNFQNDVMAISIAGRRGQLDELERAVQKGLPDAKLKMSETQLSDDYENTEKLLQVLAALIPAQLWPNEAERSNPNKAFTYSQRTQCLKMFERMYRKAKDPSDADHVFNAKLYQFYLDVAPQAIDLYDSWKSHQGFRGTGLRSIERDGREIVEVPDGIIFPILAALSAFAIKTSKGWKIQPPPEFSDGELIGAAKSVYQEIARSNPQTMGKNKACYSALHQITSIYQKLAKSNR